MKASSRRRLVDTQKMERGGDAETKLKRRPLRTLQWTLILILVGCLAGAVVGISATSTTSPIGSQARSLANRIVPADQALKATAVATQAGQTAFLEALATTDADARGDAIDVAQDQGQIQDAAWAEYLRHAGHGSLERQLQAEYLATKQPARTLGGTLIGATLLNPALPGLLASQQALLAQELTALTHLQTRVYDPAMTTSTRALVSDASTARLVTLIAAIAAFLVFLAVGVVMLRRVLLDDRAAKKAARGRATTARHADLETRLQRALEMESTERGTYSVIRQALGGISDGRAVELLVAESPHAHFQQVLSTAGEGVGACRVAQPGECPAANSGLTRLFDDSSSLDTCPYLRDHPDRVWACCVPVSIAGRTTGVLHAEDRFDRPANSELTAELELVARKSGDRIGVQRLLARTEVEAQVDPLTGLPNRRTLERRAHDLLENDREFVVAYVDLDHFKDLNDQHGHEAGDRALRLFARVLRDSIRPTDVPARYGGEEFVVVLPDCVIPDAQVVADRIRSHLLTALGGTKLPPFTVSVGLARSEGGEALSQVIDRADSALLRAKRQGRDRVIVADGSVETLPVEPTTNGAPDPGGRPPTVVPIAGV